MATSTLHRALLHPTPADLERLARRYAANPNLGMLLPDPAERTWARLADEEGAEVWLLSWPHGSETGWHDHDGSRGAFAVAWGAVTEQTWRDGVVHSRHLAVGEVRGAGDGRVHNVRGAAPGRSLTVHAVAPRLTPLPPVGARVDGPVGVTRRP